MPKGTTDVIVRVNGEPRSLLSIIELPDGSLILNLHPGAMFRELGTPIPENSSDRDHRPLFKQRRISIHPSDRSQNGVTTVKITNQLHGAEAESLTLFTTAVKRDEAFVNVMTYRCTAFVGEEWDVKPKASKRHEICSYKSAEFTLFVSLFIGQTNRLFRTMSRERSVKVSQIRFPRFNLVVLFSFLPIASHESGCFRFSHTPPGGRPVEGMGERACYQFARAEWEEQRRELVNTLSQIPQLADFIPYVQEAPFLGTPQIGSPDWEHCLATTQHRLRHAPKNYEPRQG